MKKQFSLSCLLLCAAVSMGLVSCSSETDNDLRVNSSSVSRLESAPLSYGKKVTVTFEDADYRSLAADRYGYNLYSKDQDGHSHTPQVTTGYFESIGSGVYLQMPINHIQQEWTPGKPWTFDYWNGGTAISSFYYKSGDVADYKHQCVLSSSEVTKNNKFAVCFGYSDSYNDPGKTYYKSAKIYLTDSKGYSPVETKIGLSGNAREGRFLSVKICNTYYASGVMRNGNQFSKPLSKFSGAYFKVIFVGLNKDGQPNGKTVEAYLAKKQSNGKMEYTDNWTDVDLSSLGDVYGMAITFDGVDKGAYGLNTPAYVALDDLEVEPAK